MFPRLLTLLFLFAATHLWAQDLHHSQHYLIPQQYSLANSASLEGPWRVGGVYRSQWASVPVDYRTISAIFDWKALDRDNFGLTLGAILHSDQAGDASLKWTQVGLRAVVDRKLSKTQALYGGFGVDFQQRSFDISGLTFNRQWDGDLFNASLPTMENLNAQSGMVPSFSAGIGWRIRSDREPRSFVIVGLGLQHLNKPKMNFTDDVAWALPMRQSLVGQGSLYLNDLMDWRVMTLFQHMGSSNELVLGTGLRYWLEETALQFNVSHRLGDAWIPAILVERSGWQVGISYDVNVSDFKVATNRQGAFEVGVVFTSLPVPPVKALKVCPIF
ncbi:MAG: PorP/SprF family type IX secretion system membrane protein [Saprospiraceae bacterium]